MSKALLTVVTSTSIFLLGGAAATFAQTSPSTQNAACEAVGVCERLDDLIRGVAGLPTSYPAPPPNPAPVVNVTAQLSAVYVSGDSGATLPGTCNTNAPATCDAAALTFCRSIGYPRAKVVTLGNGAIRSLVCFERAPV